MTNTTQLYFDHEAPTAFLEGIFSPAKSNIHIFSGLDAYPSITTSLRFAINKGEKNLGLMVEPGIQMGWRGWLRPRRAKVIARKYLKTIRLVLAMGRAGTSFYRRAGFAPSVVFPYMYQAPVLSEERTSTGNGLDLTYVGKFDRRKGVDILLRALAVCRTGNIQLRIIGGGAGESELKTLCERLGIESNVHWMGVLPVGEVLESLIDTDVCVVPSRFEGWGAVVNEAIGVGTPVICSDRTTSRDLVEFGGCGRVFRSGSHTDLANKIEQLLGDQDQLRQAQTNARSYRHQIAPDVIAAYLSDVLNHRFRGIGDRPAVPWEIWPGATR